MQLKTIRKRSIMDKFVERRKQREINRMSKDNLYKLLDGTDYMKNPDKLDDCLLYTSPSPRDLVISRMPSSA